MSTRFAYGILNIQAVYQYSIRILQIVATNHLIITFFTIENIPIKVQVRKIQVRTIATMGSHPWINRYSSPLAPTQERSSALCLTTNRICSYTYTHLNVCIAEKTFVYQQLSHIHSGCLPTNIRIASRKIGIFREHSWTFGIVRKRSVRFGFIRHPGKRLSTCRKIWTTTKSSLSIPLGDASENVR